MKITSILTLGVATILLSFTASCAQQSKETNVQGSSDTTTETCTTVTLSQDTVYPQFPGGIETLDELLRKGNIPLLWKFEVDESGKMCNLIFENAIQEKEKHSDYSEKIAHLPKWVPGSIGNKHTKFQYCVFYHKGKIKSIEVINCGTATEKHKLVDGWKLADKNEEGAAVHPIYKGESVQFAINYLYEVLIFTETSEAREYPITVSDKENKFTIEHTPDISIEYSYSINETCDTMITRYTDGNGKDQRMTWISRRLSQKQIVAPPTAKLIYEILEIVEEDTEIEETEIMSVEDQGEVVEINEDANIVDKEEPIYQVVEHQPKFPGGMQALMKYLRENIKNSSNLQGKVYVNFVVNTDGSIQDVEIMEGSRYEELDREAIRVVKNMPKWIPGMHKKNVVRVRFTLPVTFRLK